MASSDLSLSDSARVSVPAHVVTRPVGGESILLNLETECYIGLDEVGTRMLDVLASSGSIGAAFETLLSEFDVDGDRLRADLHAFVAELAAEQLVEIDGA